MNIGFRKMQTLILAGGQGTRIAEHTKFIPKPMVKIGKKPILCHIIDIYLKYKFNDFVIAVGFKSEVIKKYFLLKNNPSIKKRELLNFLKKRKLIFNFKNYKLTIVETGLYSQTGDRVVKSFRHMNKQNFFLTYGDGLSNVNIKNLYKFHNKNNSLLTVTAVTQPPRFGQLILKNKTVEEFAEKKTKSSQLISGGFFVVNPDFVSKIKKNTMFEIETVNHFVKKKKVKAFVHKGFWQCMDTKREKDLLEEIYKKEIPWLK